MTSMALALEREAHHERDLPALRDRKVRYAIYYEILSRHWVLTTDHRERLARLQQSPRRVLKGDRVVEGGQGTRNLYAVQQGWACSKRVSRNGHGQILDLYLPGDIIGLRDYHGGGLDEVVMLTEGLLVAMPKSQLKQMTRRHSELSEALLAAALHQGNIIADRLNNLLSHDATTRLAHLLLELHARAHGSDPDSSELVLPVSQQVIGDLLGMTNVHVCRCMTYLEARNMLRRQPATRTIHLLDRTALSELSGFAMSYVYADLSRRQRATREAGQRSPVMA